MSTPTKSPMRTCAHCGHLVPSSQAVCIYCGKDKAGVPIQPAIINPQKPTGSIDPKTLRIILIVAGVAILVLMVVANMQAIVTAVTTLFGIVVGLGILYMIGVVLFSPKQRRRPAHRNTRNPMGTYTDPADGHTYRGTQAQIYACIQIRQRLKIKFEAAIVAAKKNEVWADRLEYARDVVMSIEDCSTLFDIKSIKLTVLVVLVENGTIHR